MSSEKNINKDNSKDSLKRNGMVLSVVKAMELVKALLLVGGPSPLHTLSEMTGYPKSTAYAILSTMRDQNFITQNEDGRYYLGMRFYECGQAVSRSWNISNISRPYLEKLSANTKTTSILSLIDSSSVYNIDYVSGGDSIRVLPMLGKPLPVNATSQGKLFLASMPDSLLSKYLSSIKLNVYSASTITKAERLIDEVALIKQHGYAFSEAEYIHGIRSVSALYMTTAV